MYPGYGGPASTEKGGPCGPPRLRPWNGSGALRLREDLRPRGRGEVEELVGERAVGLQRGQLEQAHRLVLLDDLEAADERVSPVHPDADAAVARGPLRRQRDLVRRPAGHRFHPVEDGVIARGGVAEELLLEVHL